MLTEMSGIPFGLMSEMLDHPNPWHGMVFSADADEGVTVHAERERTPRYWHGR